MKTTDFARLLSSFLSNELPIIQNQSKNTIISYRDTYIKILSYMQDCKGIKAARLTVADLTVKVICDFLVWLEIEQNNSISTRNQRLAAIHSLFRYTQIQSPEYMFQCQQILAIPFKKTERKLVRYLAEDETKALLAVPDTAMKKGRRDQMILCLLYDSGARVQELADLRVKDLRLGSPPQVSLTGKGRKTRSVPLMDKTVVLLKQYLEENNLENLEHPLFFNYQGKKLTRQGITYLVKKYASLCNIEEISPHRLRHTKAMHMTEANLNPIFIRDFLGHTDLKVTGIYSKTSVKMKKEALDKINANTSIIPDKQEKEWTEDEDLMGWLTKFRC